jgi:hypothetical protein
MLNTRDEEIEMAEPIIEIKEIADEEGFVASANTLETKEKGRDKEVLKKFRAEYRNPGGKNLICKICFDYQDVFYLPGDKLSCTNAVRHSINLVPRTIPINTRPYRLPETQKQDVDRQVTKQLQEGIIEQSCPTGGPSAVFLRPASAHRTFLFLKIYNCKL